MGKGHQLSLLRQLFQGAALKYGGIILEIVENLRLQHHISGVDGRAIRLFLLPEGLDRVVAANIQHALLLLLHDGGQGGDFSAGAVEIHKVGYIDIAHAVAIGEHEGLISDIFPRSPDPAASHGVQAGVHYRGFPWLGVVVVDRHLIAAVGEIVCNVGGVQEISLQNTP